MGKTIIRSFGGRKFSSHENAYTKEEAEKMASAVRAAGTEAFVKKKRNSDYCRVWQRCHQ
jgi:hypothetical protein